MNLIVKGESETRGNLWLGDYKAASDKPLLQSKNIRMVVTTASGLGISFNDNDGIVHRQYNLQDIPSQNIAQFFDSTFHDIDEGLSRGGVLVHCAAGISRSSTCLIAYLMRKNNTPMKQTLDYVRSKRRIVCPNYGFERQLKAFELSMNISSNPRRKQTMFEPMESEKLTYLEHRFSRQQLPPSTFSQSPSPQKRSLTLTKSTFTARP